MRHSSTDRLRIHPDGAVHGLLVLGALLALALPASAQQPEPLQKSEVIRLLSGGTYSQGEVASIVERSCLSFQPTPRDLANFRELGAGDRVMRAIEVCAEAGQRPAAAQRPQPQTPQPAQPQPQRAEPQPQRAQPQTGGEAVPAATLFVAPRQSAVEVGEEVAVTAELTLGASPVANVRLELRRGTPGEDGEVVASGVTGADGRATLRVPGAADPGFRWFSVMAVDRPMRGENVIEVRTSLPEATSDPRPPAREGRSSGEREPSPEEETARQDGGTAPSDVSPVAESIPLLPKGVSIEDREAALSEAKRLSREGRYGHAEAVFRRLLEESDRDVEVLLEYGRHLSRAGRHAEADRMLDRAETLAPSHLEVLKARAFVKLWLDEPAQAVRRYRRVVELNPEDVGGWRGLARALAADEQPEEAREAARRAAELASSE